MVKAIEESVASGESQFLRRAADADDHALLLDLDALDLHGLAIAIIFQGELLPLSQRAVVDNGELLVLEYRNSLESHITWHRGRERLIWRLDNLGTPRGLGEKRILAEPNIMLEIRAWGVRRNDRVKRRIGARFDRPQGADCHEPQGGQCERRVHG